MFVGVAVIVLDEDDAVVAGIASQEGEVVILFSSLFKNYFIHYYYSHLSILFKNCVVVIFKLFNFNFLYLSVCNKLTAFCFRLFIMKG